MIANSTGTPKATMSYSWTGAGLPLTVTDPVGMVTRYTYDEFGNRLSTIEGDGSGPLSRTTAYAYNAWGDVISITDPNGNVTRVTFDLARRPVETTTAATPAAPGGIVTTNSYDADGRLLQARQSSAGTVLRTTSATWTPTGKQASATDANGNVTTYAYDILDRLARTTDAEGRVTTYEYDNDGRPTATYNLAIQSAALVSQTYTPNGLRASLTDAKSNKTDFTYDDFDRLITTTYPATVAPPQPATTETFTYDNDSNIVGRESRAGEKFVFDYDGLNRLIMRAVPGGQTISYSYDLAGRLTSVGDNSAAIVPAVSPTGSTVTYATTFTYDALNRPTGIVWDPAPAATAPAAGPLVTFGHSYDRTNRRSGQTVDDNTWLAYPTAAPSTAYTANELNQYSAVTGLTPSYSANGNLTGDGTYTYGYDAENRLVSATGAGNIASYAYDGRGWRKRRTVNGTTTISVTDTDNREVLEYDGSTGAILRWYAYGLGPNDVLNQMNVPGGTRSVFLPDIQDSVIATYSSAGVLAKSAYQPYGGSAAPASPFAYTAQRIEPEAGGVYYYRARQYSTALGRFLQADPGGYAAGTNLYAYVHNDPPNLVDPDGKIPTAIFGFVVGALGNAAVTALTSKNTGWALAAEIGISALTGGAVGAATQGLSAVGTAAKLFQAAGASRTVATISADIAVNASTSALSNTVGQGIQVGVGLKTEIDWGAVGVASAAGAINPVRTAFSAVDARTALGVVRGESSDLGLQVFTQAVGLPYKIAGSAINSSSALVTPDQYGSVTTGSLPFTAPMSLYIGSVGSVGFGGKR